MAGRKYKVLIIDDLLSAIAMLRQLVEEHAELEYIGHNTNPVSAMAAIVKGILKPDIVLLDIEMPQMSGFAVAKHIAAFTHIIFVTAHEEHAFKAFTYEIEDFIGKNSSRERFDAAIGKSIGKILLKKKAAEADQKAQLLLKIDNTFEWFAVEEIEYFEGLDYLARVIFSNKPPKTVGMHMKEMEEYLSGQPFLRIHKSYIVNVNKISSFDSSSVLLESGQRLPLGRRYKKDFKEGMAKQSNKGNSV